MFLSTGGGDAINIYIEVKTSEGTKRGSSSGRYRDHGTEAIKSQRGTTKMGALLRLYRPEITAILAGEL